MLGMPGMMVLREIRHRNVVHLVDADLVFCRHANSLGWPAFSCRETQVSQKQKTPETQLEEEKVGFGSVWAVSRLHFQL